MKLKQLVDVEAKVGINVTNNFNGTYILGKKESMQVSDVDMTNFLMSLGWVRANGPELTPEKRAQFSSKMIRALSKHIDNQNVIMDADVYFEATRKLDTDKIVTRMMLDIPTLFRVVITCGMVGSGRYRVSYTPYPQLYSTSVGRVVRPKSNTAGFSTLPTMAKWIENVVNNLGAYEENSEVGTDETEEN